VERKLIDRQAAHPGQIDRAQAALEGPLIELLHGVPAHPKPLGDVLDGQELRQRGNLVGQALRHPLIAIQPRDVLDRRPTPRTLETGPRHHKPGIKLPHRQIADPARRDFVNLSNHLAAPATALPALRLRLQLNHETSGWHPEHIRLQRLLGRHCSHFKPVPPSDLLQERTQLILCHGRLRCQSMRSRPRLVTPNSRNSPKNPKLTIRVRPADARESDCQFW
jgi:hypothetical protein